MLLRSCTGQRLEPVRIMGRSLLDRPLLHRFRDLIRNERIQFSALLDRFVKLPVDIFRQAGSHDTVRENILPVDIRNIESFPHRYNSFLIPVRKNKGASRCLIAGMLLIL